MLLANKNTVDKYMIDNWTSTPIAFDLENFTMPSTKRWISVQLMQYDRELIGLAPQHGRKLDYGLIIVKVYDTSFTKSYLLVDEVIKMLECVTMSNSDGTQLMVGLGTPDVNGYEDLQNGVFRTTINFKVKKYN